MYPEDVGRAPELATAPTRRIVSHGGPDDTVRQTAPAAVGNRTDILVQHLVVSVDQPTSFTLQMDDLYPTVGAAAHILWRDASDGGRPCTNGSDAIKSGCVVNVSAAGELFDVSTTGAGCTQLPLQSTGPSCQHSVRIWQAWVHGVTAELVILGDLGS